MGIVFKATEKQEMFVLNWFRRKLCFSVKTKIIRTNRRCLCSLVFILCGFPGFLQLKAVYPAFRSSIYAVGFGRAFHSTCVCSWACFSFFILWLSVFILCGSCIFQCPFCAVLVSFNVYFVRFPVPFSVNFVQFLCLSLYILCGSCVFQCLVCAVHPCLSLYILCGSRVFQCLVCAVPRVFSVYILCGSCAFQCSICAVPVSFSV